MAEKIVVNNLYKVFGPEPRRALDLLDKGWDKNRIFEATGLTVGVQDAGFSVREGEIFVVMGLSGSGKSTLVRLLNRLIEPTSGEVKIDDRDIAKLSHKELIQVRRSQMSMVFQSFALLPNLTVADNAAFGLEISGVDARTRRKRAVEALEKVGLGSHADSYPRELSGGMQQRVGLARALAVNPQILLMDEAFSALDPLIRTEMQDELLRLQDQETRTIVFISHDLDEAIRIGDRIAVMEGGRIVQIGSPDEIIQNPADDYVRAFFKGVDISKVLTAGDVARPPAASLSQTLDKGVRGTMEILRRQDREYAFIHDNSKRFRGIVSTQSLLQALERQGSLQDALLKEVETVTQTAPLEEVLGKVAASPWPLPVVDDNGVLRGIISKTALLEALDRTR